MSHSPRALAVLLLPLLAAPSAATAHVQDDWFGSDKALHYGISVGLAGAGYGAGALLFDEPHSLRWITGTGLALGMGLGKELYDAGQGRLFSLKDLTWDALGTATGLTLSWLVERLVTTGEGGQGSESVSSAVRRAAEPPPSSAFDFQPGRRARQGLAEGVLSNASPASGGVIGMRPCADTPLMGPRRPWR